MRWKSFWPIIYAKSRRKTGNHDRRGQAVDSRREGKSRPRYRDGGKRGCQTTRYIAIRVRKGENWGISQLIETEAPPPNACSQLAILGWLVGTRQDKGGDQTVETKINWAGDKIFSFACSSLKEPNPRPMAGNYWLRSDPAADSILDLR
jgi:hypothetical protein